MSPKRVRRFGFLIAVVLSLTVWSGAARAVDCNNNGVEDAQDIADGTSEDCQPDGVPDECQLAEATFTDSSGQLAPIDSSHPQSHTIVSPPAASSPVTFTFIARSDLNSSDEFITVFLNSHSLGTVFGNASSCPFEPDNDTIVLSASAFNAAVGGGNGLIEMIPNDTVSGVGCPSAFITVSVLYSHGADCNGNIIPDECDLVSGAPDCNENAVPDECEPGGNEDCNGNQTADLCDMYSQTSWDCNGNVVPDECDIAGGEPDADGNGVPDICEPTPAVGDDLCYVGQQASTPCGTNNDCPGAVCGLKSRYITFEYVAMGLQSIRITILDMPQFPSRVGQVWWAGPQRGINNFPNPALHGAEIECTQTPHSQVWPSGYLHLFGTAIVPGSTYEIRTCIPDGDDCSDPFVVATGKWGDAVSLFGGSSQPNFSDVNAIIQRFAALPSAPIVVRTDLVGQGGTPNGVTNFVDIAAGVSAFQGLPYPDTVPACP